MHATRFRLDILRAAFPPGTSGFVRQRRAVGIAEITGDVPRVHVPRSGPLRSRCGDLVADVSGRRLTLRAAGSIQDLDAGRPVRMRGCGGVGLPAGPARLTMAPAALAPYTLRLRSGTPPRPAAPPGRVIAGDDAQARLDVRAPARLVLAEAYTAGRRASCDGRDLGPPQIGDGFGTAWRVPAGCRDVEIGFAPNRLVNAGYAVSLLACLVLAGLALRRRRAEAPARLERAPDRPPARVPAGRAALLAVPIALALGFMFAARATPLFGLAAFFILWRGIPARPLALAAGALLLVVVPVLTLAIPVDDRGGFNPSYAGDRVAVHWVTAAAVVLLLFALARELASVRRSAAARAR
jgi:hypothetical protein